MNNATRARMTMTVKLAILCFNRDANIVRVRVNIPTPRNARARHCAPYYAAASRPGRTRRAHAAAPDTAQQLCKDSIKWRTRNRPSSGNGSGETGSEPQVSILAQYIKDLSVENPSAPQVYSSGRSSRSSTSSSTSTSTRSREDVHEVDAQDRGHGALGQRRPFRRRPELRRPVRPSQHPARKRFRRSC